MRTVLSVLVSLLAGLLALVAVTGALVDEVAHRPETVRGLAEQVASDDAVRAAIPRAVTDVVEDAVPEEVPEPLTQWAEDLTRPIAESVAEDPKVVQGWSDTADEARRAWLIDLDRARESEAPMPAGRFDVPFGPVAQTGLVSALGEVETSLREDRVAVPGQGLVEALLGVDVGDWAAETLIAPLYDRAAELRDSSELTMTVQVEALSGVERSTVAAWVGASAHWEWAAVAALVLLLAAVVLAPAGRRGLALAMAGLTVLLGTLGLRSALAPESFAVSAPEGVPDGVAALVREVQRAVVPALEGALAPWFEGLLQGGGVLLLLGVLVLAAELLARHLRRRRTHHRTEGSHRSEGSALA
ncbi:hypothetical protein E4A47_02920 [Micrococcus flavus]|uniref:Na+-transporting methylmalonyl-CoA/oxaloacetate decarboxylase gamma subunit n=1 Tax=Micrococcus flavus TaxID=384602 RepID=A0A4Y8X3G2_9MICC|nr:hypothetical protein [Micrococcus flavus]MBB4882230.1 Na+-transporting methylmalonyl-CoA/oxaloacetate decarboxylase gamma subunit [Micrococcus flavus]TFI03851.1 hypothetical protein E4A47_02920 [Micrococcus flavus]GGK51310.1 hypothetical protein GCM10007073_18050 [Micrococcus flavus]